MKVFRTKVNAFIMIIASTFLSSCATVPKETVELSTILGKDLIILHDSHRNMVNLYYDQMEGDVNELIDDVYTPFIIHYVLSSELESYENNERSIYGIIEEAGKTKGKEEANAALEEMKDFLNSANKQIESKRSELLDPLKKQRRLILNGINQSYENAIYANAIITAHLKSIRKVKESQKEALSIIGLEGKDEELDQLLLKASEVVSESLEKAKEIDVKSDEAMPKIKEILEKIKSITNK
jgi:hypothetical protein